MIDTHAHLDDKQFDADREDVISRAFQSGVEKIINIGAGVGSSERSVDLAQKYENIFASVGLHPDYFVKHKNFSSEYKEKLEKLVQENKVVAVGEIGLDYYNQGKDINEKEKEAQKIGFLFQLELARKYRKPVIVHSRGAKDKNSLRHQETMDPYRDILKIIKNYSDLKFVFHSFGGNMEFTRETLEFPNVLFSFTGNLTYNKLGSEIFETLKTIPLGRIMLETDCPYLAPVPMRGKRNEPAFVNFVTKKIAEIKKMEELEIQNKTSKNAQNFFKI